MRFPSISMLISRHRNPVFSPSDRNTFFFFVSPDSPNAVISFWDYDAVGEREEIGDAVLSFHRLLYSGDISPSEIISLPIVTHKPKTAPVRGCVDLRYGLVSRRPPLPAAELLARAASQQLSPFSSYLQRMIRFLQVQSRSHLCTHNSFCSGVFPSPHTLHFFFLRNTTPRRFFTSIEMRGHLSSTIAKRKPCRAWCSCGVPNLDAGFRPLGCCGHGRCSLREIAWNCPSCQRSSCAKIPASM